MSIALLWLTAVGDAVLPLLHQTPTSSAKRPLSAPVQGWITLILTLLKGQPLPYGYFNSYPWLPLPEE